MGPVNSDVKVFNSSFCRATTLLLLIALATFSSSQAPPLQAYPPSIAAVAMVQVPDVRGRRAEDAEVTLRKAGLTPGKTSSAAGPGIAGTVLRQDPSPNAVVVHGTTFNLVLVTPGVGTNNDGDQEFSTQVPKLNGLTPNQASALLEQHRLRLGSVQPGNGKGSDGTIFDQQPQAGGWVRTGSTVAVSVVRLSNPHGSAEIIWVFVPDLTGQNQEAAEEILRKQNLTVGTISSGSASTPVGTVFWQLPLPKTRVVQGSHVDFRIANEPPPPSKQVAVPDLFNLTVDSARSQLGQTDLQLGQVMSEESGATANLILSQSPTAGTEVDRGSAVDIKISQPISSVSVPDIVRHEETDAIHLLEAVGLHLGTVDERQSEAATGTVLLQTPEPGTEALKGTAVNVTLSRQNVTQLNLLVNPANPTKGHSLQFHAHLDPLGKKVRYRFYFGDQTDSGWLTSSNTTHIYQESGNFRVYAVATSGEATITSEEETLTIPPSLPLGWAVAALTTGLLALGGAGYSYWGRMQFRRLIRISPKMDIGTQKVSEQTHDGWDPCARVWLVHDPGKTRVLLNEEKQEGYKI